MRKEKMILGNANYGVAVALAKEKNGIVTPMSDGCGQMIWVVSWFEPLTTK